MLNVAIKAARAAGALINRAALDVEAVRVSVKQTNDFVTEVDQAAEAAIIETLLTAYPGHGILAEESGSEHGAKDSELVWIIDPLDGTTNFIHGFPFYCVSIALAVRGKIEQAVVYDPTRNDIYSASKGRGAYVNDRRLRVGKRTRLQECLISTGFPYRPGDKLKPYLNMLGEVMSQCAGVRRPGTVRYRYDTRALLLDCHIALDRRVRVGRQRNPGARREDQQRAAILRVVDRVRGA